MKIFKRAAILLMSIIVASTAFAANAAERKTSDFAIRDPCVLNYEGKYYMYGTGLAWPGYGCVVSEDLESWSQNYQVFKPSEDFEGTTDFWAPECHYYNGSFYLFATYRSKLTNHRGVAVFKASSPLGPFEQITDGSITPKTRDCIDGTLYVDDDGCRGWFMLMNGPQTRAKSALWRRRK